VRIDGIGKALGISTRAVYRRIDALSGILDPFLTRGPNNDLIFNGEALAILRRLEAIRKTEGKPLRQASRQVIEELDSKPTKPMREGAANALDPNEVIRMLQRENERLQEEVRWLRSQVDELRPLALPRPRRWFGWIRARQVQGQAS